MNKEIILFLRFLKENNAYEQFLYNFEKIKSKAWREYWRKNPSIVSNYSVFSFLNEKEIEDWIMDAFPWASTKEGSNFWRDLHKKWVR